MGFIYGALRMANDYLSTAAKISVRADANDTIVAAVTKARREELEIAQDRFSAAVHMVAFFRQNWKCVPTPLERKFLQGKGGKNFAASARDDLVSRGVKPASASRVTPKGWRVACDAEIIEAMGDREWTPENIEACLTEMELGSFNLLSKRYGDGAEAEYKKAVRKLLAAQALVESTGKKLTPKQRERIMAEEIEKFATA